VSVIGDVVPEADETFFVNLSAPSGATIGDGQGQGTIVNDDGGGDTTGELSHRFRITGDLSSTGGTPDTDEYQISQNPFSSYEVVVDGPRATSRRSSSIASTAPPWCSRRSRSAPARAAACGGRTTRPTP
jgi:hypothetical protein